MKTDSTMKPVSMKLPKSRQKEMARPIASGGQQYPWGLEITLEDDALKKLGMDHLPAVGVECKITGMGKVTSIRESASEKSETRSVGIQITKLALVHEDNEEAFERGYRKTSRKY